jgi:hypothetical protein
MACASSPQLTRPGTPWTADSCPARQAKVSELLARAAARETQGDRALAASGYDAALGHVIESDCGSPRDAIPAVQGLARLAASEAFAENALVSRRTELRNGLLGLHPTMNRNQAVAFGAMCVATRRWDLVAEALRTLRGRGESARELRVSLLSWASAQQEFPEQFALIADEADQLQVFLSHSQRMAEREDSDVLDTATLLYETFLRAGRLSDARRIADRAIGARESPRTIEQLARVAASLAFDNEVQRLRLDAARSPASRRAEVERLLDALRPPVRNP